MWARGKYKFHHYKSWVQRQGTCTDQTVGHSSLMVLMVTISVWKKMMMMITWETKFCSLLPNIRKKSFKSWPNSLIGHTNTTHMFGEVSFSDQNTPFWNTKLHTEIVSGKHKFLNTASFVEILEPNPRKHLVEAT